MGLLLIMGFYKLLPKPHLPFRSPRWSTTLEVHQLEELQLPQQEEQRLEKQPQHQLKKKKKRKNNRLKLPTSLEDPTAVVKKKMNHLSCDAPFFFLSKSKFLFFLTMEVAHDFLFFVLVMLLELLFF